MGLAQLPAELPLCAASRGGRVSGFRQDRECSVAAMLPHTVTHRFMAIVLASALLAASPAQAQGLGFDVDLDHNLDLEGIGVELGVGGGTSGVDTLDAALGLPLTLGQDAALQAVRSRLALPLDEVMLRAQLIADGDIIDAELIAVQDVLLYEFKVLSRGGRVSELYFYARSGMPVE
jgi:uncharacterized membrane protein YkoI